MSGWAGYGGGMIGTDFGTPSRAAICKSCLLATGQNINHSGPVPFSLGISVSQDRVPGNTQ